MQVVLLLQIISADDDGTYNPRQDNGARKNQAHHVFLFCCLVLSKSCSSNIHFAIWFKAEEPTPFVSIGTGRRADSILCPNIDFANHRGSIQYMLYLFDVFDCESTNRSMTPLEESVIVWYTVTLKILIGKLRSEEFFCPVRTLEILQSNFFIFFYTCSWFVFYLVALIPQYRIIRVGIILKKEFGVKKYISPPKRYCFFNSNNHILGPFCPS